MIIVAYDIASNKSRTKFSKFLKKFGKRIQYSIFQLKNSERILKNILTDVELRYKKEFSNLDNILVMHLCEGCKKKIKRYGNAVYDEEDIIFFD
ncbi:CRISPR-associated endonuclease Cas2 [Candidatus Peregrinibacteria bacterium RIFOXYC2_FULL_33_13]|nr:MAG: hypothetical protein UR27_C0015G0010 [Candidatus Peregrinibacteria bacterium GW2011_GWA2_33_10]KKP39513.1 MAG: hypothetical protein UR30_C0010G0009 [Candidatus Peregrinibacteria bacterium GW2011_GWC2_33_13]OGJ49890.1 MAG: CRISPR-associated endonuclease Cas2 [Candidatus Peregrinibacteria bacterium RIFOXYA2_FULL_33_7]OGJ54419.1 MAG: CRISPR-associated endonuclease Cas2 [Candidatus Peregrinibacteria bacterium RIFOXYC2_FULL_33_13]